MLSLSTLPLALPPHPGSLQFGPLPGGPGLVVLVTVPAQPGLPAVAGDGMPHCPHSVTVQGPTGRPSVRTRMRSRVALLRFYGLRSFVFFKCENLNHFIRGTMVRFLQTGGCLREFSMLILSAASSVSASSLSFLLRQQEKQPAQQAGTVQNRILNTPQYHG